MGCASSCEYRSVSYQTRRLYEYQSDRRNLIDYSEYLRWHGCSDETALSAKNLMILESNISSLAHFDRGTIQHHSKNQADLDENIANSQ